MTLRTDQIETLIEYFENLVKTIVREDDSVESAMDTIRKRETLKDYVIELVGAKND